jgi:hypothetical protein
MEGDQTNDPGVHSTGRGGGLASARARLGGAALAELVTKRESGVRLRELAEQYGISISTVKRVLKRSALDL